ncbi:MAG: cyclic nucleotide-binding domain-containing protein [Chloroflexi bacterium]|nr:cyclic nucleotide-binding domain-containing protein [Chloroflexota bacterium]
MISPELLRRYPFFGSLSADQLKQIAMMSDEVSLAAGVTILEEGKPAQAIYLLMEGAVDVFFSVSENKEFFVAEINPGEAFGISAMVDPYTVTTSVRTSKTSRVIKISATELRKACAEDSVLAAAVYQHIAKSAIERLDATRVQLVAAR